MRVVFVATEYRPFAKVGGLGDAVSDLARSLVRLGARVHCVVPRYGCIDPAALESTSIALPIHDCDRERWAGLSRAEHQGVQMLFVEHDELFGNRGGIYGDRPAHGYADNLRRFAVLSRAALEACLALELRPQIVHAHDWHSALVPFLLKREYVATDLGRAATILGVHNLGYQGRFPLDQACRIGIDAAHVADSGLEHDRQLNLMAAGIRHADRVVAVSPRYAQEIRQPRYGHGLHRTVQARGDDVLGIINGIDDRAWDPASDPTLAAHFNADDVRGKRECKRALQAELGLEQDDSIALIGFVGRLVEQKGIDALLGGSEAALPRVLATQPVQVVLLGSGEAWAQERIVALERAYRHFAAKIGYDDALAHRIEAGCDLFLMPSVWEPCGLNQMYSMRYGAVPVVTHTGGLVDTVDSATGFFAAESTPREVYRAVSRAVDRYYAQPAHFHAMRKAGMQRDFGWDRSARAYLKLYRSIER